MSKHLIIFLIIVLCVTIFLTLQKSKTKIPIRVSIESGKNKISVESGVPKKTPVITNSGDRSPLVLSADEVNVIYSGENSQE